MTETSSAIYEIRVKGRLRTSWGAWFDDLVVSNDAEGTSVIRGPVVDQAALHGLLHKLRDVGLVLESLTQVDETPADTAHRDLPSTNPNQPGATP